MQLIPLIFQKKSPFLRTFSRSYGFLHIESCITELFDSLSEILHWTHKIKKNSYHVNFICYEMWEESKETNNNKYK